MTDDSNRLTRAVNDLHEALQNSPNLNPEGRQLLEQVLTEVRNALQPPPSDSDADQNQDEHQSISLRRQLAAAAMEFEGDHPALAGTLKSVIDALAQIGI